jgi:tetratricopeptide (TPR) repeat protein
MVAAKMDKKDLEQPDAFQEVVGKVMDYVRENRQKLYAAAGALALVIVLGTGYFFYSANTESEAGRLYFEARMKLMSADPMGTGLADPEAARTFEGVVEKYPSSDAAQGARYELGNLYFTAGEFDRSIQVYRVFIDKASGKDIRTVYAWFGIGYAYEAKKEYDKALEAFTRVVDSKPGNTHEGLSYRNIARIYEEMNDRGKALEFYNKALEKTKDPAASLLLKRKIAQLG